MFLLLQDDNLSGDKFAASMQYRLASLFLVRIREVGGKHADGAAVMFGACIQSGFFGMLSTSPCYT